MRMGSTGGQIGERLASLSGLVSEEVGEALAYLASQVPSEYAIVELGSYRGKSTCYLATGAREGNQAQVWAIDPWDLPGNAAGKHGYRSARIGFHRQVAEMGLGHYITPVQAFSTQAAKIWTGPEIGLLFIDGSHVYEDVRDDWRAWRPHLARGAVVAFDDYRTKKNPGVTRLVDELVEAGELKDLDTSTPPLAVSVANG